MGYQITALQEAIQTTLNSDSTLQTLLGSPVRLYDHAPPNIAYPYVLYGDQRATPFDAKDRIGLELTLSLLVHSRARGRTELRAIEAALYNALHAQSLTVSGVAFCQCLFQRSEQKLQPDGITYRARLDFRLTFTDPTS